MKYIQLNSIEPNPTLKFLIFHLGIKSSLGETKRYICWYIFLKYSHTYNIRHTVRRGQNNFCIQNYLKKEEVSIKNWENCKNNPWWSNKFLPTHSSDLLFCPPLSQSKLLVFDRNHSDLLPKSWKKQIQKRDHIWRDFAICGNTYGSDQMFLRNCVSRLFKKVRKLKTFLW